MKQSALTIITELPNEAEVDAVKRPQSLSPSIISLHNKMASAHRQVQTSYNAYRLHPKPHSTRASSSNGKYNGVATRLRILYCDDTIKQSCDNVTRAILRPNKNSNNSMLAQKALRYRNVLDKVQDIGINYEDPELDIFQCLGVEWCKVTRSTSI